MARHALEAGDLVVVIYADCEVYVEDYSRLVAQPMGTLLFVLGPSLEHDERYRCLVIGGCAAKGAVVMWNECYAVGDAADRTFLRIVSRASEVDDG